MEESENNPLLGGKASNGSRKEGNRDTNCKLQLLGFAGLLIFAFCMYPPGREPVEEVPSIQPIPSIPADGAISPLMYRPFCLTHHKSMTARVLQTSMGSPSQQWSHIPCYSQPEKVRLWASSKPNVNLNEYGSPDAIVNISLSKHAFPDRTPILGFGAAFTEASSLNYQTLNKKGKAKLMELVFGKSGLGYSLGRVHINSCDFSVESYSFDETDGDFDLEDFDMDVTHDSKTDGMIDMILRATSVFNQSWSSEDGVDGNFKMYSSPWSPPAWMKSPTWEDSQGVEHASNMTYSAQPSCLREGTGKHSRYAKAWALYFSKFITACKYHKQLQRLALFIPQA